MNLRFIVPQLALLACAMIQSGCADLPRRSDTPAENTPHVIHLIQAGWHTELLFDGPSMLARSAKLRNDFHGHNYLIVGWGDGEYFVTDRPPWTQAVKALVASSYPALQVGGSETNPPPQVAPESSIPLALTERGYQQLIAYIDRSIAMTPAGRPIYLGKQQPNLNLFYQATGDYGLFSNCNSWVAGALKAAELPVSGFNLTAQSVFDQARRISKQQQQARTTPANGP